MIPCRELCKETGNNKGRRLRSENKLGVGSKRWVFVAVENVVDALRGYSVKGGFRCGWKEAIPPGRCNVFL